MPGKEERMNVAANSLDSVEKLGNVSMLLCQCMT